MTTPSERFTIRRITPETCDTAFIQGFNARFIDAEAEDDQLERPWTLEAAQAFVQSPRHVLLIAEGVPVGEDAPVPVSFLTGHLLLLPDGHNEMLLYEIGTHSGFRKRGTGAALIDNLKLIARELDAAGMWVLTHRPNTAAMQMYARTGGEITDSEGLVMFDYEL